MNFTESLVEIKPEVLLDITNEIMKECEYQHASILVNSINILAICFSDSLRVSLNDKSMDKETKKLFLNSSTDICQEVFLKTLEEIKKYITKDFNL